MFRLANQRSDRFVPINHVRKIVLLLKSKRLNAEILAHSHLKFHTGVSCDVLNLLALFSRLFLFDANVLTINFFKDLIDFCGFSF